MRNAKLILAAGVVLLAPALVFGNGFALFEHGARGVAMGGAFCAIADDATANYYNPAGLAFLDGTQVATGAYLITETANFKGMNYPYPGADYRASMEQQIFYPFHLHMAGHLSDSVAWGFAIYNPFGLGTWWSDDFAGRYITKRIDLKVFNLNPNVSFKVSDKVSFGIGVDYFLSAVDLTKSVGAINPYTQRVAEIAQVHMYNKMDDGIGFNLAFMAKPSSAFSVGASYRSRVKVKYDAEASFVQIPTGYADFDALVSGLLPFATNPKGTTEINFPAEYRLGFALHTGDLTTSLDAVLMDWDSFESLPLTIIGYPALSSNRYEGYKDAYTFRLGFQYRVSKQWSWLWGALYDETPEPDVSVSPLLPDANRWGLSAGFSYDMTERMRFDLGYLYLRFEDRSTRGQDQDNFNGWYRTIANLLGFTLSYKF
jgi:long-chain fatty acid transport protein